MWIACRKHAIRRFLWRISTFCGVGPLQFCWDRRPGPEWKAGTETWLWHHQIVAFNPCSDWPATLNPICGDWGEDWILSGYIRRVKILLPQSRGTFHPRYKQYCPILLCPSLEGERLVLTFWFFLFFQHYSILLCCSFFLFLPAPCDLLCLPSPFSYLRSTTLLGVLF